MSENNFNEIQGLNANFPQWLKGGAFNTYWTYSFVSRAAFYSMINPSYYDFMNRWVRHWYYWYDGWVPYFHNQENGIQSTRIATALCDRTAKKVVGGRIMFKNAGKERNPQSRLNGALKFIGEWSNKTDFSLAVKRASKYACSGGTSLIKLNRGKKGLWAEALRFDSFIPTVGLGGTIEEIKCFIQGYTQLANGSGNGKKANVYYLVERRYFGDYRRVNGELLFNVPLVEFAIHKTNGNLTTGQYISGNMNERIMWNSLPREVRDNFAKAYPSVMFDEPMRLPFNDSLGCELVKWTDGISNIPELPFGESLLSTLIPILMAYDYYFSAFETDMYTGRARVLTPKGMESAKGTNYNSGLDSFIINRIPYTNPDDQKPIPLQFDLRAEEWAKIRDTLVQNIALQTGLNISTIASFLNDTTGNKTAREISTEENETAGYVDDKRELIEKPLNRILKFVTLYYGFADDVVIRWSGAGLTNRFTLAEIISMALGSGFISKQKAVQMFNFDDDDAQVEEEYLKIEQEQPTMSFNDNDYFGDNRGGEKANE